MIGSTLGLKVHLLCFLIRRPFFFSTSCYFNVVAILFLFFLLLQNPIFNGWKNLSQLSFLQKKIWKNTLERQGSKWTMQNLRAHFLIIFENWSCYFLNLLWILWSLSLWLSMGTSIVKWTKQVLRYTKAVVVLLKRL